MKKNLIPNVVSAKKIAKGLLLIVVLCALNSEKTYGWPDIFQAPVQQPPSHNPQKKTKIDTSKFSSLGKYIVKKMYDEGNAWNDSWDEQIDELPDGPEKEILKSLGSKKAKKVKRSKENSSIEARLRRSEMRAEQAEKIVEALTRQPAQTQRNSLSAYEYALEWGKSLGIGGASVVSLWALSFSAVPVIVGGVAAMSVQQSLKFLKDEMKSGRISKAAGGIRGEVLIKTFTDDSGRYPTYGSKEKGITEKDIQDIENLGPDFDVYCRNVLKAIAKEQNDMYKKAPDIKIMDKKIDDEIFIVRSEYFDADPKEYIKKIEAGENIIRARAVISEYLRAGFREQQQEILKENKRKEEEERNEEPQQQSSWWNYWKRQS